MAEGKRLSEKEYEYESNDYLGFYLNNVTRVHYSEILFTYEEREKQRNDNIKFTEKYSLIEFSTGQGTAKKFIIVSPDDLKKSYASHLPLRSLTNEEISEYRNRLPTFETPKKFSRFCNCLNRLGITTKEEPDTDSDKLKDRPLHEIWGEALEEAVLTITDDVEISKETIEKINIEKLIEDFLTMGYEIDEDLKYVYRSKLINFSEDVYKNRFFTGYVMPYNDHSLFLTNTQTGKTSISKRISPDYVYDDYSKARMLGYSSSEQTASAELDGRFECIFLDDFQKIDEGSLEPLTNAMVSGHSVVGKGCRRVEAYTISTLCFLGNTGEAHSNSRNFMRDFESFLRKFGTNVNAFGSRFAVVYFNNKCRVASLTRLFTEHEQMVIQSLVKHILDSTRKSVEDIFMNQTIKKWLNESLVDYSEEIDRVLESSHPLDTVNLFFQGHKAAYKRIKGFALKQAIINKIDQLYKDRKERIVSSELISNILEDAEIELSKIQEINLNSIKLIIDESKFLTEEGRILTIFNSMRYLEKALILSHSCYMSLGMPDDNGGIADKNDCILKTLKHEIPLTLFKGNKNISKLDTNLVSLSTKLRGKRGNVSATCDKSKEICRNCPMLKVVKGSYGDKPMRVKEKLVETIKLIPKRNRKLEEFGFRLIDDSEEIWIENIDVWKLLAFLNAFIDVYVDKTKEQKGVSGKYSEGEVT